MPLLRRHGVSIAMAVLAAALAAYLYLVDSSRVTTKEAESRKRNLLPAYRRAEITALTIEQQNEVIGIVKRTDDAGDTLFYLSDGEVADQSAVDKVLGVLEFATPERRVDAATDRHVMGLDAPRVRVTLAMGTLSYHLSIGAPAPAPAGAAYAEVDGAGLYVVPRDLVTELSRPRDTYRGRTLVPYLSSILAEIALDGAGGERRFAKGAWGGWAILRGGQKIRADRDTFDRLLTSFAELRAEAFTSDAEAEKALAGADAKVRLTMVPRDTALPRAVLDIGGACPGHGEDVVAVRVEPAPKKSACVPRGVMDALSTPAARFVDLRLFTLRTDEMEQISLVAGDEKLEIVRLGPSWHLRAPAEGNVELDVGQAFARTLQDLVAERIVDGGNIELVRGRATLTKAGAEDDAADTETVEFGSPRADGAVYVRRAADGVVLRLEKDDARALLPSGLALRSRKVIEETASHVRRVTIASATVHEVIDRSSTGGFTLLEPKSLAVDPGLAGDIVEAFVQLRAERWVAERDDGSFGLEAPRATYELGLEAGTIRVETGRATSGGVFARRGDKPEVFVLADTTQRTLETWAVDRSYFMIEPNEIRRIQFRRGNQKWTLEAAPRAGSDAGAMAERFETARRTLGEMRAEAVVHVGDPRPEEGFERPLLMLEVLRAPPAPAPSATITIQIGRGDVFRDTSVFYARRAGVDATFAIAQSKLRPLLDLK